VVFLKGALDPVNIPKLSSLLLSTIVAAALVTVAAIRGRVVRLPVGLPAAAAAGLLTAFSLAAVNAPHSTSAVLGAPGRNSGLLAYGAALLLYVVTLMSFRDGQTRLLAYALMLAGGFTALYGLLQRLGVDPVAWANPFNPIIASLGNPDFASGYLGIAVPIFAWGAVRGSWHVALRLVSATIGALALVVALLSHAVQGPIAAVAGLAIVGLAFSLDREGRARRAGLLSLGAAGLVAVSSLLLGAAGTGPAASVFSGVSFDARACYWRGALTMWRHNPLTGVGLDSFGLYWRRDQPLYCPKLLGPENYTDAAHSVPLQHLAQGGVLLAAAYVFFSVVVIGAAVAGLRTLRGEERLLLAGLSGAWLAYRVQAAVSIDQVPLLLLDFVLGAAVVVASGRSRTREWRLPGAPRPVAPGKGRTKRAPEAARRQPTPLDAALIGGVCVLALLGMWQSLSPLRASRAALRGDIALTSGDGTAAVAAYEKAIELEPGVGLYRTRLATVYARANEPAKAVPLYMAAFRIDPAEVNAERIAAGLAEDGGNVALARRLYTAALDAAPLNSKVIQEYAAFERRHGGNAAAARRLERAVRDLPDDADLWAVLGASRRDRGDLSGARVAWERAVQIQPDQPTAVDGLKELNGSHA
jgi:tetratricopeptide (TPR) repeat protein